MRLKDNRKYDGFLRNRARPHNWRRQPAYRFGDVGRLDFIGYTIKHVCFECRKVFTSQSGACCPECQGPVYCVGPIFRAPRRRAVQEWKALKRHILTSRRFKRATWRAQQDHRAWQERGR